MRPRNGASVETFGPAGVEMEALTAVQIALLTIYAMVMAGVHLVQKHGGKWGSCVAAP